MTSKPMVSVCIAAYNHERYLADALDSVLSQKVKFDIEVIIGEDYSTDSTLQIAQRYQARFPDLIKVVHSGHREKLVINGNVTARYNFLNILSTARGKYIAWLDGDDYWIDTSKLQKQVDFLEQHEEYSFVFHNVYMKTEASNSVDRSSTFHPCDFDGGEGIEEKFVVHNIAPTSSIMARNNIPNKFPEVFYKSAVGDWPFHIYNLNFGKAKYMRDIMAAYRIGSGLWSKKSKVEQILPVIQTYRYLEEIVPTKLKPALKKAVYFHYRHLYFQYKAERKYFEAVRARLHLVWCRATGKIP